MGALLTTLVASVIYFLEVTVVEFIRQVAVETADLISGFTGFLSTLYSLLGEPALLRGAFDTASSIAGSRGFAGFILGFVAVALVILAYRAIRLLLFNDIL